MLYCPVEFVVFSLVQVILSLASPISVCPSRAGIYYVVDDSSECVYHLCFAGSPTAVACPQGTSTQKSYEGSTYPCVLKNQECTGLLPADYFTTTTTTTEGPIIQRSTPFAPSTTPDLLESDLDGPLSLQRLTTFLVDLSKRGTEGLSQIRMYASMLGLMNSSRTGGTEKDGEQVYQLKMYAAMLGLNTTSLYRLKMLARNAGINETVVLARLKGYALFMINTSSSQPASVTDEKQLAISDSMIAMYSRVRAAVTNSKNNGNRDDVTVLLRDLFNVTLPNDSSLTSSDKEIANANKAIAIGPEDIPTALLETIPDHRVIDGRLTCERCELRDCLAACYNTHGCAAVDYDWQYRHCYLHTLADVCGPLISLINVTHYRRLLCSSGIPTVPARFGMPTEEETVPTTTSTVTDTTTLSAAAAIARLLFASTSLPNELNIARVPAPSSGLFSNPHLGFASPTSLPVGWIAYPGFHVANANKMVTVKDGDTCIDECRNRGPEWCTAVDYNTALGQCFFHRPSTACARLHRNPVVYHVKIIKCDDSAADLN